MQCKEIQGLLSPYIDGELSEKEMATIREHLLLCPECNREYLLLKEMTELLGTAELVSLPKGFDAGLREALEKEGKPVPLSEVELGVAYRTVVFGAEEDAAEKGAAKTVSAKGQRDELAERRRRYRKYGSIAAAFLVCIFSVMTASIYDIDLTGGKGTSDLDAASSDMILADGEVGEDGTFQYGTELLMDSVNGVVEDTDGAMEERGTGVFGTDSGGSAGAVSDVLAAESLRKEGAAGSGAAEVSAAPAAAAAENPENQAAAYPGEAGRSTEPVIYDDAFEMARELPAGEPQAETAAPEGAADQESMFDGISQTPTAESEISESETELAEKSAETVETEVETNAGENDESSPVMKAAYESGAKTYNEALDFVSLIADNNTEGLVQWLLTYSPKNLTNEQAWQLASEYMEKYKAN